MSLCLLKIDQFDISENFSFKCHHITIFLKQSNKNWIFFITFYIYFIEYGLCSDYWTCKTFHLVHSLFHHVRTTFLT